MTTISVREVRIGDRLRVRDGIELTVTRIDEAFMGQADLIAFIEDSAAQWLKVPAPLAGEVELLARGDTDGVR